MASVRSGRALYRSGLLSFEEHGSCLLPGILHKVSLVEASDGFGRRLTLVHHAHTGEYSLIMACQPQGAGLADDDVEDAWVAGWAGLMEALGSELGVTQMAVTVDTSPDSGIRFRRQLSRRIVDDAPDLAARAMAQVMDLYATGGARSDVLLTLTFRYRNARDGKYLQAEEAARRIGQLVPDIQARIGAAGGGSPAVLMRRRLQGLSGSPMIPRLPTRSTVRTGIRMSRGAMPALWHARRIGTGTVMIPPCPGRGRCVIRLQAM